MASPQAHSAPATFPSANANASPVNLLPIPSFSLFASQPNVAPTWLYTTLAIVVSLLALEQGVYRYKKRHLPGPAWTIPIIGRFIDSLHPTLENYKKGWASGDLSAVSVFNMCVLPVIDDVYRVNLDNQLPASLSWHPRTTTA